MCQKIYFHINALHTYEQYICIWTDKIYAQGAIQEMPWPTSSRLATIWISSATDADAEFPFSLLFPPVSWNPIICLWPSREYIQIDIQPAPLWSPFCSPFLCLRFRFNHTRRASLVSEIRYSEENCHIWLRISDPHLSRGVPCWTSGAFKGREKRKWAITAIDSGSPRRQVAGGQGLC